MSVTLPHASSLLLEAVIGGQKLQALLDTDGANSMLSANAAARLGVAGTAKEVVTRGADGADAIMRARRIPDVSVAGTHSLNFAVLAGDVRVPFAEMILGINFWRSRRLWIDYANQVAYGRSRHYVQRPAPRPSRAGGYATEMTLMLEQQRSKVCCFFFSKKKNFLT